MKELKDCAAGVHSDGVADSWNPVKELKDNLFKILANASVVFVESGEGIGREQCESACRDRVGAVVEWNPMKELKGSLCCGKGQTTSRFMWNPVKELKGQISSVEMYFQPIPWNPVKELKDTR